MRQTTNNFVEDSETEGDWVEASSFPTLQEIYRRSKVNLEEFFKSCVTIAYKTSNNQEVIGRLPFWQFRNILVGLEEIIKAENGDKDKNDNEQQSNDYIKQAKQQTASMQQQARGMLKTGNMKIPKIPSLK